MTLTTKLPQSAHAALTPIATQAPASPTRIPTLVLPVNVDDLEYMKANFGCTTNYADFTHDGLDFSVRSDSRVAIYAVADGRATGGYIEGLKAYQVTQRIGSAAGKPVWAVYVHITDYVGNGQYQQGEIVGYIDPGAKYPQDHVHLEFRVGDTARFESASDGALGDEVDVTDTYRGMLPEAKVTDGC